MTIDGAGEVIDKDLSIRPFRVRLDTQEEAWYRPTEVKDDDDDGGGGDDDDDDDVVVVVVDDDDDDDDDDEMCAPLK